jgi:hypothetical protein
MKERLLSPKATRKTKRRIKKELEAKKKAAKTKKETAAIQNALVSVEDTHSRRPRCANFGEMIQTDACLHHWFGKEKSTLHIAVDDATGMIVGAFFDAQETLEGYYNVFYQILTDYGIPYMFFTDRRTVFEYKSKAEADKKPENDTFTQFAYACKRLGVGIKTSSVPQAKGRVERMFQTLQGRLPVLMRLAGVTTVERANAFLNSYIKEHNAEFALTSDNIPSVFEKQPDFEKINLTLAVLAPQKVDAGHSVRFENKYFKTVAKIGVLTSLQSFVKFPSMKLYTSCSGKALSSLLRRFLRGNAFTVFYTVLRPFYGGLLCCALFATCVAVACFNLIVYLCFFKSF